MGLEYKIIQSERKELDKVTCDRCGHVIEKESEGGWNPCGEPYSVYHEPHFREEYFVLDERWGYSSNKDGQTHKAVVCEPCYDIVFAEVKIQVTEYF
jgi:hypothetical protein